MKKEILAFPLASEELSDRWHEGIDNQNGMTLRDYFAAKAMQGMVTTGKTFYAENYHTALAKSSYAIADAMLKAREQ